MIQLTEETEIDPRLKKLSYSSQVTLHKCPKKYQLYKCGAESEDTSSVTFAFGHAVGEGIQSLTLGLSLEETVWRMFLAWDYDLLGEEDKAKKSFWYAVYAIIKFQDIGPQLLRGYEVALIPSTATGKLVPATELSFVINLPSGFTYIGYVDLVLRHKETGKLLVLEVKSTKFREVSEASYKNSAQAIGYSVVLDAIESAHGANDYRVMYLVYKSSVMEFEPLIFPKTFTQRALWIQQIMLDCDMITHYATIDLFPLHGESCFDFFRPCEYLDICTLDSKYLISAPINNTLVPKKEVEYTINITLADLINSQLAKHIIGEH